MYVASCHHHMHCAFSNVSYTTLLESIWGPQATLALVALPRSQSQRSRANCKRRSHHATECTVCLCRTQQGPDACNLQTALSYRTQQVEKRSSDARSTEWVNANGVSFFSFRNAERTDALRLARGYACRYVDGGSDVAKFHFPQAVAATRGFVFVADHENNRIRSVAVDSGACVLALCPSCSTSTTPVLENHPVFHVDARPPPS